MIIGQELCVKDVGREFLIKIISIEENYIYYQYIHGPSVIVIGLTFKRNITSFNNKLTQTSPEEYKLKHL